jgi:hypothetical protein
MHSPATTAWASWVSRPSRARPLWSRVAASWNLSRAMAGSASGRLGDRLRGCQELVERWTGGSGRHTEQASKCVHLSTSEYACCSRQRRTAPEPRRVRLLIRTQTATTATRSTVQRSIKDGDGADCGSGCSRPSGSGSRSRAEAAVELEHGLAQLSDSHRVQPRGRFVGQQHLRSVHDRLGGPEPQSHAGGEGAHPALGQVEKTPSFRGSPVRRCGRRGRRAASRGTPGSQRRSCASTCGRRVEGSR